MEIMADQLEPEETAVWRVLLDATIGDHLTVTEIVAVASAEAHLPITDAVVHEVMRPLLRNGYAIRMWVRRRGGRVYAYTLTIPGRVRAHRLLG